MFENFDPEHDDFEKYKKYKARCKEFHDKSDVLRSLSIDGHEMVYNDFVNYVYPGVDELMVITSGESYQTMNQEDLFDYMSGRNDVYVSPCTFIRGYYKKDCCYNVYAFVVDIDDIKSSSIARSFRNGSIRNNKIPCPTIITNSGRGVHFYYVFNRPIPHFKRQSSELAMLYRKLCDRVAEWNFAAANIDYHSYIQPYRLPGSQTKLELYAEAYRVGPKWDITHLSSTLDFDDFEWELTQVPLLEQKEYNRLKKERKTKSKTSSKKKIQSGKQPGEKKKRQTSPEQMKGFYEYALHKSYKSTRVGNRYKTLVALTMIAYKAQLPIERLREDLENLSRYFDENSDESFSITEVKKALRAYNVKALRTRAFVLEEYFGWEFERWKEKAWGHKPKKTQAEHLKMARAIRDLKQQMNGTKWTDKNGRPVGTNKQEMVQNWKKEHPDGSKADCNRDTKLDPKTIRKWW